MKKTILLLCLAAILMTTLFFTSCKNNNGAKESLSDEPKESTSDEIKEGLSMWEVFSDIEEHLTPALKELSSTIPPGDLTPIECLRQAPETLVGTHISLSLTDISEKDVVVYRFRASDRQLVIKYSRSSSYGADSTPIMLVMTVDVNNMKSFLAQKNVWSGTVTAVKVIDQGDLMTTFASVYLEDETEKTVAEADKNSAVCFGTLMNGKWSGIYDGKQPWAEGDEYATRFAYTIGRFGIK